MASLYELSAEMADLMEAYDMAANDAERDEAVQSIIGLQGAISEKADTYAKIIRNKLAEADAFKKEAKRLTDKARTAENLAERLKDAMLDAMKLTGQREIVTTIGKWRVQNNPWACDVVDIERVPAEYHIKQEDKIDKVALLKQFKETGEIIPGCTFRQEQGIRFK